MSVAVLGCGPAGLFAAQAFKMHGLRTAIISKKVKSNLYGAQYLHRPIPGLSSQDPTGWVKTRRQGRPEVYAERVYGLATMPTSWERVSAYTAAWDLRETYDRAWEQFEGDIIDHTIEPDEVTEYAATFDIVVSTVQRWAICTKPRDHYFYTTPILVQQGIDLSDMDDDMNNPDWVIYNGTHEESWYRASHIFGHTSIEARCEEHLLTNKKWEPGYKIVGTDCDCHPTVVKAGRMGLWERGVLTHHAFERAVEAISNHYGSVQPQSLY